MAKYLFRHKFQLATAGTKLYSQYNVHFMYVCMYVFMYVCMYVCMYICMYVYYVCMYVCMYMHTCTMNMVS